MMNNGHAYDSDLGPYTDANGREVFSSAELEVKTPEKSNMAF